MQKRAKQQKDVKLTKTIKLFWRCNWIVEEEANNEEEEAADSKDKIKKKQRPRVKDEDTWFFWLMTTKKWSKETAAGYDQLLELNLRLTVCFSFVFFRQHLTLDCFKTLSHLLLRRHVVGLTSLSLFQWITKNDMKETSTRQLKLEHIYNKHDNEEQSKRHDKENRMM